MNVKKPLLALLLAAQTLLAAGDQPYLDTGGPTVYGNTSTGFSEIKIHVNDHLVPPLNIDHFTNFSALVKPRSGWWWNPQEGGTGINLDIQQGNIDPDGNGLVFVSYYVYDNAGNPVWYTWAGFWEPASWREWRDTGVLGYLKSMGNVQKTINGRPIGGPQRQPEYVDAGLGQAVMAFTGTDKMTLTLGGETRSFQWMEWKDDLADSSRCTQGTPENPAQCKYSVLDSPRGWYMRGVIHRGHVTRDLSIYYQGFVDSGNERLTALLYRDSKLDGAGSIIFDPDARLAFYGSPSVKSDPTGAGNYGVYPVSVSRELGSGLDPKAYNYRGEWQGGNSASANMVIQRDAETGEEYLLFYDAESGASSTGYDLNGAANDKPALKLVYIDKDTAVAFAWDTMACFLEQDGCDPSRFTDDEMSKTFVIFKRLIRFRYDEEQDIQPGFRYWKK